MPTPTPFATAFIEGSISYGRQLEFNGLVCTGVGLLLILMLWLVSDTLLKPRDVR